MSRKSMIWGLSALELAGVHVLGARADQKEKRALGTRSQNVGCYRDLSDLCFSFVDFQTYMKATSYHCCKCDARAETCLCFLELISSSTYTQRTKGSWTIRQIGSKLARFFTRGPDGRLVHSPQFSRIFLIRWLKIVERVNRIAREPDASEKRKTWLGRGWGAIK